MGAAAVSINPPRGPRGDTHAILWGRGRFYRVEDFPGPFSIKSVLAGSAVWETRRGRFRVDERSCLVLNDGESYTITIDSETPVETFCVFFERGFVEAARASLVTADARMLDEVDRPPSASRPFGFSGMLLPKDRRIAARLSAMHASVAQRRADPIGLEDGLHRLAAGLGRLEKQLEREVARVPAARASTREEIFRRLHAALDFIDASLAERLTLEEVARAACLAPHHFHRLFTRSFGETPHRYVTRRRLERARELLLRGDRPITEICFDAGFESPGSFSWLFRRRFGASPREFRRRRQKGKI